MEKKSESLEIKNRAGGLLVSYNVEKCRKEACTVFVCVPQNMYKGLNLTFKQKTKTKNNNINNKKQNLGEEN